MKLKMRRVSIVLAALIGVVVWLIINPKSYDEIFTIIENTGAENGLEESAEEIAENTEKAIDILEKLEVKGRAPKTGYSREKFYDGWPTVDGCSLRQRIIRREFGDSAVLVDCNVVAGEFDEPYTGEHRVYQTKNEVSSIQIDHVVALSDAWQKGAQYMEYEKRNAMATDPLNLLAVDGDANKQKSDGDAATWLPKNKKFRCQYVARQVSVKYKYGLWVTEAEKEAISRILTNCPNEPAIGV
ncbi:HNH endonuclease [Candidatus Saccharibacteria bacterium]|nr:HNH endonuclease [Candidatus Saccharibacteria bacterium]